MCEFLLFEKLIFVSHSCWLYQRLFREKNIFRWFRFYIYIFYYSCNDVVQFHRIVYIIDQCHFALGSLYRGVFFWFLKFLLLSLLHISNFNNIGVFFILPMIMVICQCDLKFWFSIHFQFCHCAYMGFNNKHFLYGAISIYSNHTIHLLQLKQSYVLVYGPFRGASHIMFYWQHIVYIFLFLIYHIFIYYVTPTSVILCLSFYELI